MKRSGIPATVKDTVWRRCCGSNLDGVCFICNSQITYNNCHVAHIIPVKLGGSNNVDNLRITCMSCNLSMGTQNLLKFKQKYFEYKKKATCAVDMTDTIPNLNNQLNQTINKPYLSCTDFYKSEISRHMRVKNDKFQISIVQPHHIPWLSNYAISIFPILPRIRL